MKLNCGLEIDERAGSQPVLFCLHGIGGNTASFAPQLQYFENRQQIVAWNMPGYGESPPLPETTFAALAQAVVAAMDELDLQQAILVGQSIGGMIALEVACRYPDRVAALVLMGTTPSFGGRDDSFKQEFLKARLAPLHAGKTMADLAPTFVPQIVGSNASEKVISAATASMAAVSSSAYSDTIECLVTFNRRAELETLCMPCLLIAGDEDQNAPARTMRKMSQQLPNAQYHCIKGAGHLINLEAGDDCNRLIDNFLGELL